MDNFETIRPKAAAKTDWNEARKKEAINEYLNDFRDDIAKQMGLNDITNIYPNQIISFAQVNWPKPNIVNWGINY